MTGRHYYNPVLLNQINSLVQLASCDELVHYLQGLNHREKRMAALVLSDKVLPGVEECVYWRVMLALCQYDSKAYLITVLKALDKRYRDAAISLQGDDFDRVACFFNTQATPIDRRKMLNYVVSMWADDIEYLSRVMQIFQVHEVQERLGCLLRVEGVAAYYLLFLTMRTFDYDHALLTRCCRLLIKKGTPLSFNLALIAKQYFDLEQVQGTFSLRVLPHELSRIESSYEAFKEVMESL